jgi:hypothetical protein
MKKTIIIIAAVMISMLVYMLSSCYSNKQDILALPKVSFRKEVVPIVTSGPCGCHNTSSTIRAVLFSDQRLNIIYYDAILARKPQLGVMANGGEHPGSGNISFSQSEKNLIKRWIDEGGNDDGEGCIISGAITYTKEVLPIYNVTCKGATCHGGIAAALDYSKLVANKDKLTTIMSSGGSQGHPGGVLSLTTCTINKFKEWIAQGQPQ